jgi:hypothetical protein
MDYSQLLAQKADTIVERWVEAVSQDRQIKSADDLPRSSVRDHIPHVLAAMATVLDQSQSSNIESLIQASLEHGILRADQGFNPAEIAREYRLLRQEIFSAINADLQLGVVAEVIQTMSVINAVVDEAIAVCFRSYMDERLRELEQLQIQLTLTNQELTRLIRSHQDNLSHLAHELKNPLNSIIGYSDLFLRSSQHHTEVKETRANLEYIERVLRNGRRLLRLINDALEISRYEAGEMKLQPVPTDVRSLIKNVFEVLEPLARAKELQIVVDCARAPEQVLTDSSRLHQIVTNLVSNAIRQIVTNLVSNAIRYTESRTVKVTCFVLADDQWEIAVTDTGIGIAKEDQARIFEPYVRAGSTGHPHLSDSTGLGLAIVLRLVKLLQGKIKLVSQVGVGSTFTVILPLSAKTIE